MSSPRFIGLQARFQDLDSEATYAHAIAEAASDKARNFVVEFNLHEAKIAFNLDSDDFQLLVSKKPPEGMVRWINIWSPNTQRPTIECIGNHYGFSQRLQALMTSRVPSSPEQSGPKQVLSQSDIELGSLCDEPKGYSPVQTPAQVAEDLEIYQLVKETVNYTSVDQGKQFICIGANWLHHRPEVTNMEPDNSLLPPRHWSWLTLCSNSVVVSLHETPSSKHPDNQEWTETELRNMRSNTTSVLCQISRHGVKDFRNRIISLKPVRQALPDANSNSDVACEGSSNLFYYLFEDYSSALPVLKTSRDVLHRLKEQIFTSNSRRSKVKTTDIIRSMHTLRQELRQLQHLFESYKSLIRRICWPQSVDAHREGQCGVLELSGSVSGDVKICSSARSRFERLGDRLQLLMLNTIQEYLDEQNALSGTYFSLTAQKDSQATARLSRSATVLAKLSVFFLPITFMTSYFSVEIPDLVEHYTPKMYWICFAVIAGLSFISLFFFSRMLEFLSDVLEEWADSGSRKFRRVCGLDVHDDIDEH